MEQLDPSKYSKVQSIFSALSDTQPMCASVLAGVYPGRVFVDDTTAPQTALLLTFIESEATGAWAFLSGDPACPDFNRDLNAALFERSILSDQVPMVFWTCDPGDWGGQLAVVFDPLPPIWFARNHYVARQAHYDWRSALPAGFAVERIDQALQLRPDRAGPLGLAFPPDIAATLDKWSRMEREGFTARGFSDFGFVTLDVRSERPMIASWATVDFIVDGRGDLGFFTQPDYRRMGLGTIAAAAALEHGFRSGLQQVNWTCDADNLGSSRTAQNLGLERIEDYQMCFLMFDEKQHMQVLQQFA